jgi:REP element-mobilizing transposase RayT
MADTFSQIYIQIIFAVQGRYGLISHRFKDELYKYITGIVNNKGQKLIRINGMPDHVHILIGLKPSMALSDLVRDIKTNSSTFINHKRWVRGKFNWQEGYGAFSYGHSQLNRVITYIDNQEKHHKNVTFKEEYLKLLKRFNIEFKDEYLFKWIDD